MNYFIFLLLCLVATNGYMEPCYFYTDPVDQNFCSGNDCKYEYDYNDGYYSEQDVYCRTCNETYQTVSCCIQSLIEDGLENNFTCKSIKPFYYKNPITIYMSFQGSLNCFSENNNYPVNFTINTADGPLYEYENQVNYDDEFWYTTKISVTKPIWISYQMIGADKYCNDNATLLVYEHLYH